MSSKVLKTLLAATLMGMSANASSFSAIGSAAASGDEYSYSYQFSAAPGTSVNSVLLGSADLGPTNVHFTLNGQPADSDWSWFANDTPVNYLDFFASGGTVLNGETLGVTFESIYAPAPTQFAEGYYSADGTMTNSVTDLVGPTSTATPEPINLGLLGLLFLGTGSVLRTYRKR